MILKKEVSNDNFYKTYYSALNGILNLTNKQIDVLAELSNIKNELSDTFTEEQKDQYTFSSSSRSIVCDKLGITIFNLNNIIKDLKKKGFIIIKENKDLSINPFLYKRKEDCEIIFRFNLK